MVRKAKYIPGFLRNPYVLFNIDPRHRLPTTLSKECLSYNLHHEKTKILQSFNYEYHKTCTMKKQTILQSFDYEYFISRTSFYGQNHILNINELYVYFVYYLYVFYILPTVSCFEHVEYSSCIHDRMYEEKPASQRPDGKGITLQILGWEQQ